MYWKKKLKNPKKHQQIQRIKNQCGIFTRYFRLQVTVQLYYISQAILYLVYLSYKEIKVKF